MLSLLRTNRPDKWNVLSNPQFLGILFHLVEMKYTPGGKSVKKLAPNVQKERSKKMLTLYQKLSKFWVGKIPSGRRDLKSKPMDVFSKKVPTKVIKFLCEEGEFSKVLKIIDQLMMKKAFVNEPELYHYKTIVKMLQVSSSKIKDLELNKIMIESVATFNKQLGLFSSKDKFYFENHMLFLNELKEHTDLKSFYLRAKIPAEHYSIRVAPLLIKCVGSSRRAEALFLQHPYSPY